MEGEKQRSFFSLKSFAGVRICEEMLYICYYLSSKLCPSSFFCLILDCVPPPPPCRIQFFPFVVDFHLEIGIKKIPSFNDVSLASLVIAEGKNQAVHSF